jgi:CubicO group peptidase (beta-lactamase class C family)
MSPSHVASIDSVLREATTRGDVPGVVAMAASDRGLLYQGAFGSRDLDGGPAMTPDTVFRIASMTKAVTSVAAMQLVERGLLTLDDPVPDIDPTLSAPQVLEGFDSAGVPTLRPARRPITLRHLLTHTAGFAYEIWNAGLLRFIAATGTPARATGKLAAIRLPLTFDPGTRWQYGINLDWVGRIVEAVSGQPLDCYVHEHIFSPLGMADTSYLPSPEQCSRMARVHRREPDGSLTPQPTPAPFVPEFHSGGGDLVSTGPDYLAFATMLLQQGSRDGVRILRPETVALMRRNQIGDLPAGVLATAMPALSNDVDFFPGHELRWGLGTMINQRPGPDGRSAGTLSWAGLYNSYYWIDPVQRVAGLIMTQILPFADRRAVGLYGRFERGICDMIAS